MDTARRSTLGCFGRVHFCVMGLRFDAGSVNRLVWFWFGLVLGCFRDLVFGGVWFGFFYFDLLVYGALLWVSWVVGPSQKGARRRLFGV